MPSVLVDAGPLVAVIDRTDTYHRRCAAALDTIHEPLLTVWPAFTEAMYLLRYDPRDQRALWEMIGADGLIFADLVPTIFLACES